MSTKAFQKFIAGAALVALVGTVLPTVAWADDPPDTTPPTVTMTSDTPDPTGANPIGVVAVFSEPVMGFEHSDVDLSSASISNFTQTNETTWTFDLTPNGSSIAATIAEHKFTDNSGNENQSQTVFSRQWDINAPSTTVPADTTAPAITFVDPSPADGAALSFTSPATSSSLTFAFTVDDASSTVECFVGGQSDTPSYYGCGSPQNFNLPAGAYLFAVKATDTSSNMASSSRTFSITMASSTATSTATTTEGGGGGGGPTGASSGGGGGGGGNGQIVGSSPTAPQGFFNPNASLIIPTVPATPPALTASAQPSSVAVASPPSQPLTTSGSALVASGAQGAAATEVEELLPTATPPADDGNITIDGLGAAAATTGAGIPGWIWGIILLAILAGLLWWAYRASQTA